jgi:hypothetical protein
MLTNAQSVEIVARICRECGARPARWRQNARGIRDLRLHSQAVACARTADENGSDD